MEPTWGWFEGREHRLPVRVYYEDTDFTGVVYHANYLRYLERGRSDFLRLAGVESLAAAIAEARDAVEVVIEPFLLQQGFISRTPRGRTACPKAYGHIGLTPPPRAPGQPGLFEE